eukprot:3539139-Pyramimonas_sp.AAC.1
MRTALGSEVARGSWSSSVAVPPAAPRATRALPGPKIRRGENTQTQFIVDPPENMGKYGNWAGRQEPTRYGPFTKGASFLIRPAFWQYLGCTRSL